MESTDFDQTASKPRAQRRRPDRGTAWSVVASLFLPPTLLGTAYGMNFDHMPELHWQYGYFIVLAIMLVSCLGLFVVFRKIKWL